ncbi:MULTISPECIES: hypothetical protein [Vogesella]|uniref:Lipoprotein n=1 Tax=Vogesella indigofera TaxID=45465 RepID=A0A495AW26_VOGIN|nr:MULTISPECIES: hypothetical protein [Vogesella]MCQ4145348.1 hypothetical protein [Vogesella sp. AC12]RKQ52942.1 hypothetical protein C8E02_3412 [Vogesella indigofera]
MWRPLLLAAIGLPLLLACSDEQVGKLQQDASAAIGVAGNKLQQASAPLAEIKQQAATALDKAGTLAGELQPKVQQQVEELKQQAGVVREVVSAWQGKGDWTVLEKQVGQYPRDSGLFDKPPLAAPLKALLGKDLAKFKLFMDTQGPLQQDRLLFVTGNKRHAAQDGAAYLLIDVSQRKLEAGLIENGLLKVYASEGTPLQPPAEVRTFIGNLQRQ